MTEMATITELRDQFTNLEVPDRGISEPLAAPDLFSKKLTRFDENLYNTHSTSHLYRFLLALCGEGGAGSVRKEVLYSKLQNAIYSTHFHDLDRLYGDPLALPRLSSEVYAYDPSNDPLTQNQWIEIYAKDANYRNRCLLWMRAIMYGGSPMGMQLAAEAACGVECDVFAVADYLNDQRSDHPIGLVNLGKTNSDGEFVIVPRINVLDQGSQRRIIALIDRIRPVDTLVTISLGTTSRTQKFATTATATSEYSQVTRYVTGRSDVNWPDIGGIASTNNIANGGFENNTTGWLATSSFFVTSGATLSRIVPTGGAVVGTHVMQIITPGGTANQGGRYPGLTVIAGQTYTFSVYMKTLSGNATAKINIGNDSAFGGQNSANSTVTVTPSYTRFQITYTAAVTGVAEVAITVPGTTATTLLVDGAQFENQLAASPYIATNGSVRSRAFTPSNGSWVQPGVENEAPTYAWFARQETAQAVGDSSTVVTSSSQHYGEFSSIQKGLFPHLNLSLDDQFIVFADEYSRPLGSNPTLNIPWMRNDSIVVNNYYPLEYFSLVPVSNLDNAPELRFWASNEALAPQSEYLEYDFGSNKVLNYLEFEISHKPIDIVVETSTDNISWTPVNPTDTTDYIFEVAFVVSAQPWRFWRLYFDKVTARYLRVTFNRRTDNFPFYDSDPFPWSIEVRNLRTYLLMQDASDFDPSIGTDIFGNTYRNVLQQVWPAANAMDGNTSTFWLSQPNPIPEAVEALYMDVSTSLHSVTMSELDTGIGSSNNPTMTHYDSLSMSNMEAYVSGVGTQTVNEIYIDPVFSGSDMHFYYTNDTNPDWESKLWIPVPMHYKCTRGYHTLPYSVTARYFKIEFSNLTPIPYNTVETVNMLPAIYRKFPSWVQNYFAALTPDATKSQIEEVQTITLDPYDVFKIQQDALATTRDQATLPKEETPDTSTDEIGQLVDQITTLGDETVQTAQESQIRFFPPTIWQDDLKNALDLSRAASRMLWQDISDDTGDVYMIEATPEILDAPNEQSAEDLSADLAQKQGPIMWFPRVCRHGYQIVSGPFQSKVAYQVAIREITFWYRQFLTPSNNTFASEYGQVNYGNITYG